MKVLNEVEEEANIWMTPMIDVVFILLVFFLVASTLYTGEKDLSVKLPAAVGGRQFPEELRRIIINVREGGEVVLDGQKVTYDQLVNALAEEAKRDPLTPIVVRGDRKVYHEDIVRILNACYVVEMPNVNIATYPTDDAPKAPAVPAAGPAKK